MVLDEERVQRMSGVRSQHQQTQAPLRIQAALRRALPGLTPGLIQNRTTRYRSEAWSPHQARRKGSAPAMPYGLEERGSGDLRRRTARRSTLARLIESILKQPVRAGVNIPRQSRGL